jgi:uncharacterized membrane-anchored protein
MRIPDDHARRLELAQEAHARVPDALATPMRVSYLALLTGDASRGADEWRHFCELLAHYGVAPPAAPSNHCRADLGGYSVRFERHTEFYRYTFQLPGAGSDPFAETALARVPAEWLARMTGETLVAVHAALVPARADVDPEALAAELFDDNALVGAEIGERAGRAFTDFRLRADGFVRVLVENRDMTARQAGRMMQRVLEIETYRMMALLALPVARTLTPFLGRAEEEMTRVTTELAAARATDEPALLERLTRLEAEIGSEEARSDYRFTAAAAYYELVQRRIRELRETRIRGVQTFLEFIERRLAPAMGTCRTVAARQASLSARIARVNQLLATRVDISREAQNQQLLESMDRRSQAQLRLQQTVEGLSIAAITYYIVGLIGYAAKGLHAAGVELNPEIVMAIGIPLAALFVARSVRHVRTAVVRSAGETGSRRD